MFKPLPLYIGLRYTRAKRRNHFISFISGSSMLGVMLGVAALIVVLSVMNGFHKEVRERILGMASHAVILGADGRIDDWHRGLDVAKDHPEVVGQAPFVEMRGMLINGQYVSGVQVRGILPEEEPKVSDVGKHMTEGSLGLLEPGSFNIILGHELANNLGVRIGDKVTLVAPEVMMTPTGNMPRMKRFDVAGIFRIDMGKFDSGVALTHMHDAAKVLRLGESVTGIRLKLRDMYKAPEVSVELAREQEGWFRVSDWTMEFSNFFSALRTEKRMMGMVLFLIIAVAAFNIVSTLVMVVTDKRSDIAILRTLGLSPKEIMQIFIIQGATLGFVGTVIGVIVGIVVALNLEGFIAGVESLFGFKILDPSVYYISRMPSDLHWDDVWMVAVSAFAVTLIATIYPARRAAATQPAEALRYE
ncbi:MAG: lipoprotein-releasing ABC transporter permease subunit [Gammaproteobacteria bacterium]|nr:lipoprotein-releasing ABC transporter permease subunit [Gammaproteobacteria bacterium]MBU1654009.1 lipoprotein-releasing ABC transporter permease subunit [Gammaproteobacteria bacterium]MBU1960732.1 lipoprotein-releasing ABC transporter permease subunit [Gammaproteobacteria bacterium]